MDVYSVSFFGHRAIEDSLTIEQKLEVLIRRLLTEKSYVEFLVGRNGEFDQLVSSVVRRCKRTVRDDNSSLVWVLPYPTAECRDNEEAFREYSLVKVVLPRDPLQRPWDNRQIQIPQPIHITPGYV